MGEIRKDRWEGVEYQAPEPKLEIFKPGNTNKNDPNITYSADPEAGAYSKLLGYAFSESVDDLEGSFSFTWRMRKPKKTKRYLTLSPIGAL